MSGDDFLIDGVSSTDAFWKVSSLLSEASVSAGGVDLVVAKDEVRHCEGEEGSLFVVTRRHAAGADVQWSRSDDNRLRSLKTLRDEGDRPLTEEEEQDLKDLSPRFDAFLKQGALAIGNLSFSAYIAWLPYSLVMSVNPGLLSKKGRKAVEMLATLPICCGQGESMALPPSWQHCVVLPVNRVVGIRKIGNILSTKALKIHYTCGAQDPTPHMLQGDTADCDTDAVGFVTRSGEGCPLKGGSFVTAVNDQPHRPGVLRELREQGGRLQVDAHPSCAVKCTHLLLLSGGLPALLKGLEESQSAFAKHSRDSSFLRSERDAKR